MTAQQQSWRRKWTYALLIVALFTGTLFYRRQVLEPRADQLVLREQAVGEGDVGGAAVRLTLTGSRGAALCGLWMMANDAQVKHEWNELEILVQSIIKLQPHLVSPWKFQSWNLAYNVAYECDDIKDKYFYISRGIQLLAAGERQNRDHPDLRFALASFYLDKFGVSDEADTLRTLLQLSCIDPLERSPAQLRTAAGRVDLVKFRAFCERHPSLVRRLRETLGRQTPEAIVDFLEEYRDIPSRFEAPAAGQLATRLLPPEQQFPVLPRRADFPELEVAAEDRLDDSVDSYVIARTWFQYANTSPPLPPPSDDPAKPLAHYDASVHRLPRMPRLIIFRDYPAKAQSFLAERRQREGWFGPGWEIDAGKLGGSRWFADPVVVGDARLGSAAAWRLAAEMWEAHGRRNGLLLDPPVDPDQAARQYRSSFTRFLEQARVECLPEAVRARHLVFQAEAQRKAAESAAALRLYAEAMAIWKKLLLNHPAYQRDTFNQEDMYLMQHRYLRLLQDQEAQQVRPLLLAADLLTQAAAPGSMWLPSINVIRPSLLPVGFVGPLEDVNAQGEPLIGADAIRNVRARLGIIEAKR